MKHLTNKKNDFVSLGMTERESDRENIDDQI